MARSRAVHRKVVRPCCRQERRLVVKRMSRVNSVQKWAVRVVKVAVAAAVAVVVVAAATAIATVPICPIRKVASRALTAFPLPRPTSTTTTPTMTLIMMSRMIAVTWRTIRATPIEIRIGMPIATRPPSPREARRTM